MASHVKSGLGRGRWLQKYLPFVARRPEMQIEWLVNALRRKTLSEREITPYVRLLLGEDGSDNQEELAALLAGLDHDLLCRLLAAADIYDTPKLFRLLRSPTVEQAVIALRKAPPPYEKKPHLLLDRVFMAINDQSEELLEESARTLFDSGRVPAHFPAAYERFQEILADERVLSSLYPKARAID